MIQNEAEDLLLKFIEDRLKQKEFILDREEQKRLKEVEELTEALENLRKFEEKHLEELQGIYKYNQNGFDVFSSYLFEPKNEIYNRLRWFDTFDYSNYLYNTLPDDERFLIVGSDGFTHITYKQFEEKLGLSHATAKKYLTSLKDKGKIEVNKIIFGLEYRITSANFSGISGQLNYMEFPNSSN